MGGQEHFYLETQAAWAEPLSQQVRNARSHQVTAVVTLRTLEKQVRTVRGELAIAEHLVDAATVQLVDAQSQAQDATIKLALARDVRMIEPPWTWIRDTSVMESSRTASV